jgi:hypothetical protein
MNCIRQRFRNSVLIPISVLLVIALVPIPGASGEQVYKVRIGEIGVTDFFTVGNKAFRYTERGYNSYYGANIYITPCVKAEDADCIESLSYRVGKSQEWKKAELDSSWTIPKTGVPLIGRDKVTGESFVITNRVATPADPENNYPAGGATSIWKVSETGHNSDFRLFLNFNLSGINPDSKSERIMWKQFTTQVFPIAKNEGLTSGGIPFAIAGNSADDSFGNISGTNLIPSAANNRRSLPGRSISIRFVLHQTP